MTTPCREPTLRLVQNCVPALFLEMLLNPRRIVLSTYLVYPHRSRDKSRTWTHEWVGPVERGVLYGGIYILDLSPSFGCLCWCRISIVVLDRLDLYYMRLSKMRSAGLITRIATWGCMIECYCKGSIWLCTVDSSRPSVTYYRYF